jgi:hypothetical protein
MSVALLGAGCYRADRSVRARPAGPPPSYATVAARYNQNLRFMDRLWARVEVGLRWHEEGRRQFERGEGHLILEAPDNVALSIGKLGQTGFWAGSNSRNYWLFNLRADPPEVFFGSHENVGKPGVKPLPVPVQPRDLVKLLGLTPLPVESGQTDGISAAGSQVRWRGSYLLVQPTEGNLRLLVHPRTFLPVSVELLDSRGQVIAASRLSLPRVVRVPGVPSAQWPRWPSRLEAQLADSDDRLTLSLTDQGYAGPQEQRIRPRLFDLQYLSDRHFRIAPQQRFDLDAAFETSE